MKIGLVIRSLSEDSPFSRWIFSLIKAAAKRGDEVHVIAESVSAGKVSAAGGQTHIVEKSRWGGALGRWVFDRRVKKELKAEPLQLIISAEDIPETPGPDAGDAELDNRAIAFWSTVA